MLRYATYAMEEELSFLRRKVNRLEDMIFNINDKIGLILEKFLNHRASKLIYCVQMLSGGNHCKFIEDTRKLQAMSLEFVKFYKSRKTFAYHSLPNSNPALSVAAINLITGIRLSVARLNLHCIRRQDQMLDSLLQRRR